MRRLRKMLRSVKLTLRRNCDLRRAALTGRPGLLLSLCSLLGMRWLRGCSWYSLSLNLRLLTLLRRPLVVLSRRLDRYPRVW